MLGGFWTCAAPGAKKSAPGGSLCTARRGRMGWLFADRDFYLDPPPSPPECQFDGDHRSSPPVAAGLPRLAGCHQMLNTPLTAGVFFLRIGIRYAARRPPTARACLVHRFAQRRVGAADADKIFRHGQCDWFQNSSRADSGLVEHLVLKNRLPAGRSLRPAGAGWVGYLRIVIVILIRNLPHRSVSSMVTIVLLLQSRQDCRDWQGVTEC